MKKLFLFLVIIFICSCSKEDETVLVWIDIVYQETCENEVSYLVMETDKGSFEFEYIPVSGGGNTVPINIYPDVYKINSVQLFSKDGDLSYFVYQGVPEDKDLNPVVSWVNGYEYNITEDREILFQAFCAGYDKF